MPDGLMRLIAGAVLLLPVLGSAATPLAIGFWVVALVGFVFAALSFWGVLLPAGWWRPVGVGAAIVSLAGIGLYAGTWPVLNTLAAVAVNVAVLLAVLVFGW